MLFFSYCGGSVSWADLLCLQCLQHGTMLSDSIFCLQINRPFDSLRTWVSSRRVELFAGRAYPSVRDVLSVPSEVADVHGCFDFGHFCGVFLAFVGFTTLPFWSLFTLIV